MLQQQRTHPPWILMPRWLLLGWNWKITICAPIMVLLMIFPHYAECPIGSGQNKVKKINWQGFRWTCCPIWKPDCQPPEKNKKSGKSKGWSVFCPAGGNCKFDLMLLSFLILQKKERIKVQSAKPPIFYMSLAAVHMRIMFYPILSLKLRLKQTALNFARSKVTKCHSYNSCTSKLYCVMMMHHPWCW